MVGPHSLNVVPQFKLGGSALICSYLVSDRVGHDSSWRISGGKEAEVNCSAAAPTGFKEMLMFIFRL